MGLEGCIVRINDYGMDTLTTDIKLNPLPSVENDPVLESIKRKRRRGASLPREKERKIQNLNV